MKKVCVTGSSGMLGKEIVRYLAQKKDNELILIDKEYLSVHNEHIQEIGDLLDENFIKGFLEKHNPNIIIHAAAIVNLLFCENNIDIATKLHFGSTKILADYSHSESKLIYISTDSVFDGENGNYSESDEPNPKNQYSKTKLMGEMASKTKSNHLIIRTNIFGFNFPFKNSLAEWAIKSFNNSEKIYGFTDIYFNAIYTKHLVEILITMIEKNLKGIYNVGSLNILSKYSFLKYLCNCLHPNKELIDPILSSQYNTGVSRPKNTTLNTLKLQSIMSKIPTIEDGVDLLINDYINEVENE